MLEKYIDQHLYIYIYNSNMIYPNYLLFLQLNNPLVDVKVFMIRTYKRMTMKDDAVR